MPSPLAPNSPGAPHDPGLAFVEAWAGLVRALDRRSAAPADDSAFVDAALAARDAAAGERPLRVLFARGEVNVAGRAHALAPGSVGAALAERLDAGGVAGALFEPGLRPASLLALSRQVLDAARRAEREPAFEGFDGEPVEHVHVLRRRFEGAFEEALAARRAGAPLQSLLAALQGDALDDPRHAGESLLALVREIDGDLAALEVELAALPAQREPQGALAALADSAEPLGVHLHLLTTLEDELEAARLHAPLARLVREAGAIGGPVLAPYLELFGDAAPAEGRARARLGAFLRDFELVHLLSEHGAFGTRFAAERFPEGFHLWLAHLDLSSAAGHARLCALLEEVGSARVLHAGPRLFGEARLGDPERAAALLARPHAALVPVARLLLARGEPRTTALVARFVRALSPSVPEACLLALLDDGELPEAVLAGLLDPPRTDATRATLRARVAETLCDLVERLDDGPRPGRRLAAARALAGHAGAPARERIDAFLRADARAGDADVREALRRALGAGA